MLHGAQRVTGGQPLQDAAQRYHSLFLCAPGAEAERLHRQLRQHPAECTHGKPEIMPAARRGTCLPSRGTDGDSIGTHRAYLYNRKYEIHPVDTCEAAHPYRVKDFLSDTNHTLHTAAFPACLYQADDSDHLAGIAVQRFAVTNMPIDILVKSCIITGKAWIRFMHDSTALFRMKYPPRGFVLLAPLRSDGQYAFVLAGFLRVETIFHVGTFPAVEDETGFARTHQIAGFQRYLYFGCF